MNGLQLVLSWIILFFIIFYFPLRHLNIRYMTIGYWCFFMLFVVIFEFLLPFNLSNLVKKGNYYYKNGKNFWREKNYSLMNFFSSEMYINLYADYSLADSKYRMGEKDAGFRFVITDEILHGILVLPFSLFILYGLLKKKNALPKVFTLSMMVLAIIQLTVILMYLSPMIWDIQTKHSDSYYDNEQTTYWPLLWNLPWFLMPIYILIHTYPIFSR